MVNTLEIGHRFQAEYKRVDREVTMIGSQSRVSDRHSLRDLHWT